MVSEQLPPVDPFPADTTQTPVDQQAIGIEGTTDYAYDTSLEIEAPFYDFTTAQYDTAAVLSEQPVDITENMALPTWLEGFVTFLNTYNNPTPT